MAVKMKNFKGFNPDTAPTAFSGQTAFSGHVFAPLKNPLNAVTEGFRKSLKKIFFNFEVIFFMVYFFRFSLVYFTIDFFLAFL